MLTPLVHSLTPGQQHISGRFLEVVDVIEEQKGDHFGMGMYGRYPLTNEPHYRYYYTNLIHGSVAWLREWR